MRSSRGIFSKLFVTYSLILLVSFLLFSSIYLYLFHIQLYADFDDTFRYYRAQLGRQIELAERQDWQPEQLRESLALTLDHKNSRLFVFSAGGERLFGPPPAEPLASLVPSILQAGLKGEPYAKGIWMDRDLVYVMAHELRGDGGTAQGQTVVMVFDGLGHQYRRVAWMILLPIAVTIACAGIVLWFISKRITAPLREMNRIARQLAKGNFSQAVRIRSQDEIGQLGQTFNEMARELEGTEQMRKDFIANVSHDLRSPLTSIKGFLAALLDGTITVERRKHYYVLMRDETDRLIALVNDLLDLTRLESGQLRIRPSAYNLSEQLRVIAAKHEPLTAKANVTLEVEVEELEDVYVHADPDRIEQAINNLLLNAIQHSPPGGTVIVKLIPTGDAAFIRISDQGPGIPRQDLPLIWERFYKADLARSKKSGMGIGLAIVKSIMDLHGVSIEVRSEPGQGTEFTFRLTRIGSHID